MAKSLRASVKKSNRNKLRRNVFEATEKARNERLSAKLLQLAAEPRPSRDRDIDMDSPDARRSNDAGAGRSGEEQEAMMVDKPESSSQRSLKKQPRSPRVQKRRKSKSIVFPVGRKDFKPRFSMGRRKS